MGLIENRDILQIPYSKLLKLEVYKLAKNVKRVLDNYDAEALKMEEMKDLFLALSPEIDALKVPDRKHCITPKLKRPRGKRDLYVSSLVFQHKVIMKEDPTGEDDGVLLIGTVLNKFFDKLGESRNETLKNTRVERFLDEVDNNLELSVALEEKGFNEIVDKLRASTSKLDSLLNTRSISKSVGLKVKTTDLTKPVIEGIKNVMSDLKLIQLKNPGLNFVPLVAEMNQLLAENAILINVRVANNKRKAENERLANNGANQTASTSAIMTNGHVMTQSAFTASTNGEAPKHDKFEPAANMLGENEVKEEVNLDLKQKKAVATSAKQSRLPDLKNEVDL